MLWKGIATTLLVASFSPLAHAIVIIDDFTGGEWDYQMGGFESFVSHDESGLASNHTLFGNRKTTVEVDENLFNLPVDIQTGHGLYQVAAQSIQTTYTMQTRYDDPTGVGMDLSSQDQFWIFGSQQLKNGQATWGVIDAQGRQAYSPDLLQGVGYLYTKKSIFYGSGIDWSHIKTFLFKDTISNSSQIGIDTIQLAPEPNELLSLGGFLGVVMGLRARKKRVNK